jgi:2-polyprenyl-3-methyl-5-hydroxy-6-metoxy-1,4-benzoquinol methylase
VPSRDPADFWDEQAATFDDEPDHGLRDPAVQEAWRELLRAVLPAPPADIADLGCGTGSLSVLLARDGHQVTGIDLAQRMVEAANRKAAAAGTRVTFRQGDVSVPDLPPSSFDAVVARHVVWALPDPAAALRRWYALLRAHGALVLVEGRWSTGAGIEARALVHHLREIVPDVSVRRLTDPSLWGSTVDDDRYLVVARA